MRPYLAYILFLALALRPVYNMGYIAYFQLNIDYIIETYCVNKEKPELQCNGKCHLADQLNVNLIDNTEGSSFLGSIFEAFVPVYFHEGSYNFYLEQLTLLAQNNWNYNNVFTPFIKDVPKPPPQV